MTPILQLSLMEGDGKARYCYVCNRVIPAETRFCRVQIRREAVHLYCFGCAGKEWPSVSEILKVLPPKEIMDRIAAAI